MDLLYGPLLAVHLLCVNVAAGGPLLAAWLDWRGSRGDETAARAAADLARASLVALIGGATLGLVIGWLKWDASYRSLWLGPLAYKMRWAIVEVVFSLVLTLGWCLCVPGKAQRSTLAVAMRCALAVLSGTNLLYHFPPLFSIAARLDDASQWIGKEIGPAEFRRLMITGVTPAITVHVALASFAVAGTALLCVALHSLRNGDKETAAKLARWGARWALAASLLQFPVGIWTLMTLPEAVQSGLMGMNHLATFLFVVSIGSAVWLVNNLAHLAMGELRRESLVTALILMLMTVVLMTLAQR